MKHKRKRYYERRPFKLKMGGPRYRLMGDMRYRSAMPGLSDILSLVSKPSESKESIGEMIQKRLPMFKVLSGRGS